MLPELPAAILPLDTPPTHLAPFELRTHKRILKKAKAPDAHGSLAVLRTFRSPASCTEFGTNDLACLAVSESRLQGEGRIALQP